jgi:cytochrome P450
MLISPPSAVEEVRSASWRHDPYPFFARWRETQPVLRLDWPRRGPGDWLVTRREDVSAALADPRLAIDRTAAQAPPDAQSRFAPNPNAPLEGTVLTTDGPVYLRMRAAVGPAVSDLSPAVEALVRRHALQTSRQACRGSRFDLVADFAEPLCQAIWADMMGLDPALMPKLSRWTGDYLGQGFIFGRTPVKAGACDAVKRIRAILSASLENRIAADEIGFLTRFVAGVDDFRDSTASIGNSALLLTAAMLQSTKHGIVNCLAALMARPEAWRELRRCPELVPHAVDECLRFDGPSLAVGRVATSELAIAGQEIERGAFVRLAIASANRDDAQIARAETLDIHRYRRPHLAFGRHFHACSGARLSRLTMSRSLAEMLRLVSDPVLEERALLRDVESSLRGYRCVPVIVRK